MQLEPGDAVYLPAGVPNHLIPDDEYLQLRFKAEPPGHEEISFYCQRCHNLVYSKNFDASEQIAQQVYWESCQEYNGNQAVRTGQNCGEVAAPVDLTGIVWPQVVENILKANEFRTMLLTLTLTFGMPPCLVLRRRRTIDVTTHKRVYQ